MHGKDNRNKDPILANKQELSNRNNFNKSDNSESEIF